LYSRRDERPWVVFPKGVALKIKTLQKQKNLNFLINRLLRFYLVPLTMPLSNSFYQNLTDIYSLKEILYNEGIADIEGLPIVKPDNRTNSLLPNSY